TSTATTITVNWTTPVAGAATYDVEYRTGAAAYTNIALVTSPATITGLVAGTSYDVRLIARNAIGTSTPSSTTASVAKLTAVGAPVIAVSSSASTAVLSWGAVSGTTSYKVFRSTVSGTYSYATPVATVADPTVTYTDAPTVDGTTYYYVVRTFNGSDSVDSNEVSVRPVSSFILAALTPTSATTIDVSWGAATGASTYDVYYRLSTGAYGAPINVATTTTTLTGLASNSTYNVYVVAKNAVGSSGATFTSATQSGLTATGVISNLTATADNTQSQVGLNWSVVSGATSYKIFRGATAGTLVYLNVVAGGASTAFMDTTVVNGTVYYYSVRPFNGIDSADSNIVSIKPISSFTLTAATSASATSVNLTWVAATGADTYDVYYGPAATPAFNVQNIGGAAATSYTLIGLNPATLYYITVRARNSQSASGTVFMSNQRTVTTATAAPVLSSIAAIPGQITINWTGGAGATNFNIYRSNTTGGPYSQVASAVTGSTYANTVANGSTYYYVIRAFNGSESADSNELFAQPIANFTLTSAVGASSSSIQVTWPAASGATSYDVQHRIGAGAYTTIAGVTSPYTITGLATNQAYNVRVIASNSIGVTTTVNSNEVSALTATAAPTALAAAGGTGQVVLTWTAATGAASYKIYRSTTTGVYGAAVATGVTGLTYTDTGLVNGTPYFYVIQSFNGADSANSNEVTSQPISAFAISSVTGPSSTSISVAWGSATGATSYDLKYGTVSGTYTTTLTGVTSPGTVTGLVAGTTYFVQMVARNSVGAGSSVNSAQSSGATNFLPVISTPAAQIREADGNQIVNFTLSDSNDILTCAGAVTATSSNTALVANSGLVVGGTIPNCTVTVTPVASATGVSTITLSATDTKDTVTSNFSMTFTPCAVASIAWITQPIGMPAGSLFGTAPSVRLNKLDGTLCTSNTAPVGLTVVFDPSEQQDAIVTGLNSVIPSGGVATFSGASMERAGTAFTISAVQNGVASLASSAFNVTALAASKIAYYQQPLTNDPNSIMIPAPSVRTTDTYGNYVAVSGISVAISLQDNTELATMAGTLTVATNASGIASFSTLSINTLGSYYLQATPANGWAITNSSFFDIIVITPRNTMSTFEMLSGPIQHSKGSNDYLRGSTNIGTNFIDGTTTYTWKVIANNVGNAQNTTLRLRNGTLNVASIIITKNTPAFTVFSTVIANTSITAAGNWNLRAEQGDALVLSSRLVVKQVGAKRTQIYIPLTSIENASVTGSVTTTSATHTVPNAINFPTYNWDSLEYNNINGLNFSVAASTTVGSVCAGLFNKATGVQVGSEVCTVATTESNMNVDIPKSSMPATAELEVRFRAQGGGTATLYKAGLNVSLVNIVKTKAIQRVAPAVVTLSATTNFVEQRATSYIGNYGTGVVSEYLNCTAMALTSGSGSFIYKNHGTNTSGVVGATTITASTINFSSQSSFTNLEAGPVVTVNTNNQFMNYTHTSGSFALSHCLYTTEAAY
ncbi:MAG TPA: fibronectin type III domain-containing protein, partial [Bacteriovoracaceae bacterium]|nr:fibronectin type III domain-containing protein [Bacteriovoracaceae bacterium]